MASALLVKEAENKASSAAKALEVSQAQEAAKASKVSRALEEAKSLKALLALEAATKAFERAKAVEAGCAQLLKAEPEVKSYRHSNERFLHLVVMLPNL